MSQDSYKKIQDFLSAAVAEALDYAREDEDSPIRGARFFLTEDLLVKRHPYRSVKEAAAAVDSIYWAVAAMSVEQCVEICRQHGAQI